MVVTRGCPGSFISCTMQRKQGLQSADPSVAPLQQGTSDCVACLPVVVCPKKQTAFCIVRAARTLCKDAFSSRRAGGFHRTGIIPLGIISKMSNPNVRHATFRAGLSEGRAVLLAPLATCNFAAMSFSVSRRLLHNCLLQTPGSHIPVMPLAHLTNRGKMTS